VISQDVQKKILDYCFSKDYKFSRDPNTKNIIYIEGMNTDGSLNNDDPNEFNDLRSIWDHRLNCLQVWTATTEPGRRYTVDPMNPKGAARIKFGQYTAWSVGMHGTKQRHQALVQVAPITVCRDLNKDFVRTGDKEETGLFGVNQHWGYDLPKNNIQLASAGCLVGRTTDGHQQFMGYILNDERYLDYSKYVFSTIIIPGDKL
jgi:hypothetical protein